MIDAPALLKDLKKLLRLLEADIRERVAGSPVEQDLKAEWQAARQAGRSAQAFAAWLDEEVTQAAVHWLLACVFLRFVEDNGLVARPWLSGPGERLALARDRHEAWFRDHPTAEERDYLLACFAEAAELPGMAALFDRAHNPLWRLAVSGDGAIALREFWQKRDPDSGRLLHDFTDPERGTRFLGDLYQNLSEAAQKRYALLQTPEFVEEFILDRTLEPAIREFGWQAVRLIDPACGSGHFLLGAFRRIFDLWTRNEPGRNPRDCAQRALDAVCGVDLNPFAIAIARFRLLVAALNACGIGELRNAPDFRLSLAVGDSLLHGKRFNQVAGWQMSMEGGLGHVTHEEDRAALDRLLGRQYNAVVGNPPYITVKDKALNQAYRQRYDSCHMKYSLGVPFTERFFDLALSPEKGAGFVGLITANSFMKREFGKKLIETVLPHFDLTHVVDTSGAYIPGHGTPTVILFGRNRKPVTDQVRAVMGIKGKPGTPEDPARGLVWSAILAGIDRPGSQDAFVSTSDLPRQSLGRHPWSMGGGGASELKEVLEASAEKSQSLAAVVESVGITCFTLEDEAYIQPRLVFQRAALTTKDIRPIVLGDEIRDWIADLSKWAIFPYDLDFRILDILPAKAGRFLWGYRSNLANSKMFNGKTKVADGLKWFEYGRLTTSRLRTPLTITFGEVATHNHFVLDRGGKVFNRTAPVIKLPAGATEEEHLALLGLLNSSTACFWLKQSCHNKGSTVDDKGARQRTDPFEDFYQFNGTRVGQFPLATPYPTDLARSLDSLATALADTLPAAVLARGVPTRAGLDAAKARAGGLRRRMIALQEELDWRCYRLYGLLEEEVEHPAPPEIDLGERAFEIVMARQMAAGALETTWFARHGSTPVTEIPAHWPADYRALVERRIALIEQHQWINLVERPEYKRRWQWDDQGFDAGWHRREQAALKDWLLDRLEDARYWGAEPALISVAKLTDKVRGDVDFLAVAELYAGRPDFDLQALVAQLVAAESVPFLPVLRYSEEGLRKRRIWEETWELQRREDAIDARPGITPEEAKAAKAREVGDIPVPPKYRSADFQKADYWRLRGGLDVPKERFISYPFAERDADGSQVITWAGYDHLQQATALAGYYLAMKENEGWSPERLTPLLAGLQDLLPWLLQWHNAYSAEFGVGLGDYYRGFVAEEARALGLTTDDLRAWTPPAKPTARRGRRKTAEVAG